MPAILASLTEYLLNLACRRHFGKQWKFFGIFFKKMNLGSHQRSRDNSCGPERTRTAYLCNANAVFYLVNYWPSSGPEEIRTPNPLHAMEVRYRCATGPCRNIQSNAVLVPTDLGLRYRRAKLDLIASSFLLFKMRPHFEIK